MRVYALYNLKGGVGKTSSAVGFAWLSAREGARTLLWDLDPQGAATYAFRVRARVEGGARALLEDPRTALRAIRASDFEGLDVLPSDFDYRELDLLLREERRGDAVARLLAPLAEEYDRVLIDCAPGLSVVGEHVFRAADALLVPTIPTVLSLRTLARLLGHLKASPREARPRVVPFFSMVDRRKALHRRVMAYAAAERLGFAEAVVPYASVVEQIGVRRSPLHAFAPSSAAARSYGALWRELALRLEGAEGDGPARPSRRAVKSLLRDAEESGARGSRPAAPGGGDEATDGPRSEDATAMTSERAAGGDPAADGIEREFKLALASGREADLVASALVPSGPIPARRVRQVNHFFDDAVGSLRARGFALRLREEEDGYVLTAKGPAAAGGSDGGALSTKREVEARPEATEAAAVLAEERSPLDLLAERARADAPALLAEMRAALAAPLVRVGTFRNDRRRIGPLHLLGTPRDLRLWFELDRTEFPGGHVHHELEVEVPAEHVEACGRALRALLERAGLPWRPSRSKAARLFEILAAGAGR